MNHISLRPDQRFIWHGPALFVTSALGHSDNADPMHGFYFRETRFLRRLQLRVNGVAPWPCSVGQPSQRELLFGLVYPELAQGGAGGTGIGRDERPVDSSQVPWRATDMMLRYRLRFHQLTAELMLTNRSRGAIDVSLVWHVTADYADLLECHASDRPQTPGVEAARHEPTVDGAVLRLRSQSEELPFETVFHAEGPEPWTVNHECLGTRLRLEPQCPVRLVLLITAHDAPVVPADDEVERREDALTSWLSRRTRVMAPGDQVPVAVINQAIDDLGSLALLEGQPDEWLVPAAGMPLYPGLWGRDAITSTWQASAFDRGDQLDAALTRLGRLQGTVVDPTRDEEPGRIVHSVRRGPLARTGQNPFDCYYGDQAGPFLFVIGLAQLYAWTGERATLDRHWDTARRVLDWAHTTGDRDGDGYVEYLTQAPGGPLNQGWKDSGDGIIDEQGRVLEPPIATCEVQGYWFAALQLFSALCAARGQLGDAKAYWQEAQDLKDRFNRDWWLPEEGFVGLALDGRKRLARTITSNPGHCLACGIVSADHVPALVGRAFLPDLWSGWGLRTLSDRHRSYNPVGYHLGSVWTVENATFALGLRRYGYHARALDVAEGVFRLARLHDHLRVPEAVGGYPRAEWAHPGAYPRANPVQAWNQSAPALLLQVILGMEPVAPIDLLVVDPVLPSWLPELTLEGLRVGGATVSIRFWRDRDFRSHAEIVRQRGTLHLLRQPPPESQTTTIRDRITAFVDGLVHA